MDLIHPKKTRYEMSEPLTFADQIAFDQFRLAIERNFLLHVTTGLNMTVVGLAMFRFFSRDSNDLYEVIGGAAFLIATLVIAKGTYDFLNMKKDLALMKAWIQESKFSPPRVTR